MTAPSTHAESFTAPSTRSSKRYGLLTSTQDLRALVWSLGLFPLPVLLAFFEPSLWLFALPVALYLGFCAGVLAHYHNHRPVFRSRLLSAAYSNYLGIFYGFPLFGWIPTHNKNHHKFLNGPEDATSTTKMGKDGIFVALIYPMRSSTWQISALRRYVSRGLEKNGYRRVEPFVQSATLLLAHAVIAAALVQRSGWDEGGVAYLGLVLAPALFSSWSMMFTNYLQHVDCDPNSPHNHSRNFVGSWENWFVFDAGLHTVHHEHPGVHFSEYRALHAARAHLIDPKLNERNMLTFLLKRYLLDARRTT